MKDVRWGRACVALIVVGWASALGATLLFRAAEDDLGYFLVGQTVAALLGALICGGNIVDDRPTPYATNAAELRKLRAEHDAMCERFIAMEDRARTAEARAELVQAQARKEMS